MHKAVVVTFQPSGQGKESRANSLLRAIFCSAACAVLISAIAAQAAQAANSARATQKNQAEAQRAELQQKLKALKNDINKTETAKDKASDALAVSEQAISETNRSLRDLKIEQSETEARLQKLLDEQKRLSAKVEQQKKQLSDFLRHQYMRGDSDRIKLLLSGDNPNRINRDLQYMGYVSQTQAKMIESLRVSLAAVEKNAGDEQEAKDELDEIAQEELTHKNALESEKKKRSALLAQLADKLHAQRKEADSLQKDEQRLGNLVSRLNKLIEEQIKAEQARAAQLEKQRQEKLALEKEQRDKAAKDKTLANQAKKAGKITNPNAIDADEAPSKSLAKNEQTPVPSHFEGEFSKLKGQLRLPVKGELIARFGSKRGDGPSWKGLFIKTTEGAEIKAIAAGRVIFAEWLRGFGNMIIVDHGSRYWSLYGNNQSVFKHVGDLVKAGDTIASAGNSGGNEESGLYFELRYQERVFDPLTWVTIK
ncbi:peptidoglycan DD-metalloendopeptidase family protein [Undibacterium sp. Jales W-56]|uniref:murein hydrolase activator EnvC family protein n=1 Tax=Undibacterium sp. Jales W-56 TaxID=2897325 RepID=UPI0021D0F5FD|nr:peptidoglycan DD-metalloendopeptidase family protein [Undibacterium sp. Jales W-56]MCU6434978.1 peptidoglycan DD-metalloendopeptidase family protein [Undibacterium sp. Jales W-56]